ncbi:transposase domain-containing protein [Silicimonas sp. MF1-12-2]|uniref:transposase domain-containing protein n=1 Tax=Silicimonas sp. MF1-12-2 TaxID=3384793 RepID=UPI0039B600F9
MRHLQHPLQDAAICVSYTTRTESAYSFTLNDVDPQTWLTRVLSQITDHKITRFDELLPRRYAAQAAQQGAPFVRQSAITGRLRRGRSASVTNPRSGIGVSPPAPLGEPSIGDLRVRRGPIPGPYSGRGNGKRILGGSQQLEDRLLRGRQAGDDPVGRGPRPLPAP